MVGFSSLRICNDARTNTHQLINILFLLCGVLLFVASGSEADFNVT